MCYCMLWLLRHVVCWPVCLCVAVHETTHLHPGSSLHPQSSPLGHGISPAASPLKEEAQDLTPQPPAAHQQLKSEGTFTELQPVHTRVNNNKSPVSGNGSFTTLPSIQNFSTSTYIYTSIHPSFWHWHSLTADPRFTLCVAIHRELFLGCTKSLWFFKSKLALRITRIHAGIGCTDARM